METGLNLKLKKALSEMVFLSVLEEEPLPIVEVTRRLDKRSGGVCSIQFAYAIVYRMVENGYISEQGSRVTPERRRQFYAITDKGRAYLQALKREYRAFRDAVDTILDVQEDAQNESRNQKVC